MYIHTGEEPHTKSIHTVEEPHIHDTIIVSFIKTQFIKLTYVEPIFKNELFCS